jgi:MFS transporter, FSR family, fosmidomycin resistance protein
MAAEARADAGLPPERDGYRRDLLLLSAVHAVTHIPPTLYPLVLPYAMRALGFGYAQVGVFVGAIGIIGGLLQGIQSWLSRHVRRAALCGGGNVVLGLSLSLSGLAGSFGALFGLRLLGAVAASPQHPVGASLITDWYRRARRGTAFAVHFSGGNVGTVLTPLLAGFLLPRVGWRDTLMLLGIPGMIVGPLFWAAARDARVPESASAAGVDGAAHARRSYWAALRDGNLLTLFASRILTSAGRGLGVLLTYVPLYLVAVVKLPASTVGAYVSLLAMGAVASPVVAGRVADWVGRRKPVMLVSLWISAAATAGLLAAGSNRLGILASLAVLALAVYNESSLSQTILAELVPDAGRDDAFSLFFVVSFTSGAVWALAIGLIIARWHFAAGFAVMLASYLAASLVLAFVRERPARAAPG